MHLLILKLLVLGVHFFVIFLVSLNIRVQWRAGYNKFSWSSLFLGFSLLWLVLKLGLLLRWLEPEPVWTDALFYALYWLPTTLQCVSPPPRTAAAAAPTAHARVVLSLFPRARASDDGPDAPPS